MISLLPAMLTVLLVGSEEEAPLPDDAPEIILYLGSDEVEVGVPLYAAIVIRKGRGEAPTMISSAAAHMSVVYARRLDRPDAERVFCFGNSCVWGPDIWLYSFRELSDLRRIHARDTYPPSMLTDEPGSVELWATYDVLRPGGKTYRIQSRPVRIEIVNPEDVARKQTAELLRDCWRKPSAEKVRLLRGAEQEVGSPADAVNLEIGLSLPNGTGALQSAHQRSVLADDRLHHLLSTGDDVVLRAWALESMRRVVRRASKPVKADVRFFLKETETMAKGTPLERLVRERSDNCRKALGDE